MESNSQEEKRQDNRNKFLIKLIAVGISTLFGLGFIWVAITNESEGVFGMAIRLVIAILGLLLLRTAYKAMGD